MSTGARSEAEARMEARIANLEERLGELEEEVEELAEGNDRRITRLMELLFNEGLLNRGNARGWFNNNEDGGTPTTMTSIDGNGIDTN